MHIVFNVLNMERHGAQRVILNLCSYYHREGNEISIIMCMHDEVDYDIPDYIRLYPLDKRHNQEFENKITRFIRRRKKMKLILGQIKPDFIFSFLPEPNYLLLSLKHSFEDIPIVISIRNNPYVQYKFLPYHILMKALYPKADGFVFQTEEAMAYFNFSKAIISKGVVIPNPINKAFIRKPYEGIREKRIVSVGRLEPQKNHAMLIEAFSRLGDKYQEYHLHIYGQGKEYEHLQTLIKNMNLEERVHLEGEKDAIADYVYKAALFVMSFDFEGMPNALMEAMSMGVPVISTDCPTGGPKFLINHGVDGLLVPINDVEHLREGMERILEDQVAASKMGQEAFKITERLEPDNICSQWKRYSSMLLKQ